MIFHHRGYLVRDYAVLNFATKQRNSFEVRDEAGNFFTYILSNL
jgi:hypothetical protein